MIAPWSNLNLKGRLLVIICIINICVAVYIATHGSYLALFSITVAAWCGICTYHPRYQHQDAKDIDARR